MSDLKKTVDLNEGNFETTMQNNEIVIVDFWAPWCGPCRVFGPTFEKVAAANSDVVFGKVNTEEEQEIAAAFNIRSIPTVMAFRQSILVHVQPGALPEAGLQQLVDLVKQLDMEKIIKEVEENERKEREQNGGAQ